MLVKVALISLMPYCCSDLPSESECCNVCSWGGGFPVPWSDFIVTIKTCRANHMLLNKEGISGILLYSVHKRTVAYTATFTLGAFYQNTILLMSSCTGIVYRLTSLLGCRMLGSFFPHGKFSPFIYLRVVPNFSKPQCYSSSCFLWLDTHSSWDTS